MSCNGCRVLRKGCREDCMLRQCLEWIDDPQAQANATVFVAKFFGRAGLMSSISSVPRNQRPSLFQSLLFEAVGRTVNPVSGAVGLLWTGNWHVCQTAVVTVLRGGTIDSLPEFYQGGVLGPELDNIVTEQYCSFLSPRDHHGTNSSGPKPQGILKRKSSDDYDLEQREPTTDHRKNLCSFVYRRRAATPSEESETTTFGSASGREDDQGGLQGGGETKLLRLFV
ncbi:hypothetical protein Tsubulata_037412 [Turnera subulata]|uniref:LOB domain-containing protein n=1 Tax=Turnera subulata TaxID=218843 RepID=A0A9Q0J137_9ROSI|nr:hypothetical protein Tsubulata_037412 [Turnera subulata]